MSKTISILGATGSIGRQTLDVAEQLGLRVAALTAHMDVERLEAQVRKFRPRLAVLTDEAAARDLAVRLADMDTKVLGGPEALLEAAVCPEADTVVTAVVGMVGLRPTLAAIRERKRIALANKETLVCAGQLVMDAAAAGETEVSLEGVNATAAQVDNVRAFVLARGQSAFLSDISLEENALALVYTSQDASQIQQAAQDFDKAAQSILEECYQTGYTQLQCAMALYQYLGQHVEYSYESMDDGLYGAIVDKKAMANGYANAYAFLLDQFGIENALVSAPDKSHVWNLITIDGVSYHVDVTFGANLLKGQSLKFFGMNDAAAATALGYTGWTVSNGVADLETPLCSSTRFEALQKAGRSDMDYAGNAVYMDAYEETPGVSKLDLLTGEVSVVLSEQTDGIAVLDGLLYYLRNEDGYLYTLNLTTNETVQLFEGTKVTALERRGNVIYYSAEGQSEMGQISP